MTTEITWNNVSECEHVNLMPMPSIRCDVFEEPDQLLCTDCGVIVPK